MSHTSLSNYGEYYDSSNQGQNMNNSYQVSRQTNQNSPYVTHASYPGDIRQSQYNSSGYDWSSQSQQNYPNSSRQRTYNHEFWKDANSQGASHDDRTPASNYATQAVSGSGGQSHYNSGSTTTGQTTLALNNLSYASGLEDSGLHRQGHRSQQSVSSTSAYPPTSSSTIPNQVQSPVTHSQSRYNMNPSMNHLYQNGLPSASNRPSIVSAASALAGAVSRRFQVSSASSGQSSGSPVMENVSSAQASQRAASPYSQSAKPQAQRRSSSGAAQTNHRSMNQQKSQIDRSAEHTRGPSQGVQQTSRAQPPVNSISNLVSHAVEGTPQAQYSTSVQPQTMLNYIDPSQVFNPFHKEHERRRREAAEVEAEVKRKAEENVAANKRQEEEVAAVKKRVEEEATTKAAAAAKANENQTVTKTLSTTTTNPPPSQNNPANGTSPQSNPTGKTTASETDMANELKTMMDKMREFRNKDPTLFQKLWDDMRKATASAAHSSSPQLAHQQTPLAAQAQDRPILVAPPPHQPPFQTTQQQQTALSPQQSIPKPAQISRSRKFEGTSDELGIKPNGHKVVIENNPEGLPDLGRFPAERCVQTPYHKKPAPERPTSETTMSLQAVPQLNNTSASVEANQPHISAPTAPNPGAVAKSPVLTQPLPPRGPAGGTIWPEEKRKVLAEAAVKSLKTIPENAESEITAPDIHAMLEKNPSYIDLCELLEQKGLKFHRGHFARQLLSNVPYLNGPQGKPPALAPPTQIPLPTSLPPGPQAPNPSGLAGLTPIPVEQLMARSSSRTLMLHNANGLPPGYSVSTAGQFQPKHGPHGVQVQKAFPAQPYAPTGRHNSKVGPIMPHQTEPPPGSKEAMARKRDFSELVDLTALSDNEDYVMSRKQARIESPSPDPDPFQEYQRRKMATQQCQLTQPLPGIPNYSNPTAFPAAVLHANPLKFNPSQPQLLPRRPYVPSPPPAPAQQPPPLQQRSTKTLAKPINKHQALLKTYYDAKTVARDILIAAGRHPTERPLNAHMAGLLGKHVDLDSDLSTFDWDAVDPGGPPVPQVAFVDVPTQPPRFRLGQQGIRRPPESPAQVQTSISKDKELRLPDSDKRKMPAPAAIQPKMNREVNHRLHRLEVQPKPTQSPVVQLLAPSQVRRRSRVPNAEVVPRPNSVVPLKRRPSLTSLKNSPVSQRRRSTRSSSTQLASSVEPEKMSSGNFFPSGKRRGRPAGAKTLHPGVGEMKRTARQVTQAAVIVSVPSSASPILPVFKCRWRLCKAHLHNLHTLRKHIAKVHQPSSNQGIDEGYICWWKNCQYLKEDKDGAIVPAKAFDDHEEWLEHIEEDHLYPVALRHGDGPSTKHIGKQKVSSFDVSKFRFDPHESSQSARTRSYVDPQTILQDRAHYLSDEHGRITTPDVTVKSPDDLESDTMTLLKADHDDAREQALKSFMKTHRPEKSSPRAIAEETLRAMSARKAKVGPGIDRGGCILVNEARRATLIQNQGIQRVVDESY